MNQIRYRQAQFLGLMRRLAGDRRGVSAIVTAIALTTLAGFCGLAVDVVMWEVSQRNIQGAADQAALGAVTAYRNAGETAALGGSTTAQNAAYATAIRSGYPAGTVTVAAYNNGGTCTNNGCLKVTISQAQSQYFTAVFFNGGVTAGASAVATCSGCGNGSFDLQSGGGDACVMALDASGSGVITASGTPVLSLSNCNLYNNSANTSATILNGGATIEGCTATNACGSKALLAQPDVPSGSIDIPIVTSAAPAPDPYAGLSPPDTSGCSGSPPSMSSGTVSPGTYFAGPDHMTVTLNPGTYVFCNGWSMQNGTVNGTGVFIYVLGGGKITGNGNINISAPTSGTYAGMAMWWSGNSGVQYDGNNGSTFSGAIYAPQAQVTYGGTINTSATCTRLIAASIDLHGNPSGSFSNSGCPAVAGPQLTSSGTSGTTVATGSPMLVQ